MFDWYNIDTLKILKKGANKSVIKGLNQSGGL